MIYYLKKKKKKIEFPPETYILAGNFFFQVSIFTFEKESWGTLDDTHDTKCIY